MCKSPLAACLLLIVAAAMLLRSLNALADGPGFNCIDCGPLPEGYTIAIARCQNDAPLVLGSAPLARPDSVGEGRFIDVDLEGAATHPARFWMGVSSRAIPYVATFDRDSKGASWCQALGNFEENAEFGGNFQALPQRSGIPYVNISSFVRPGACVSISADATVSWLALSKTWAVVSTVAESASRCSEQGETAPKAEEPAPKAKLHAQGLAAFRAKDFTTAEKKWRAALPYFEAIADLGFLLQERGRDVEAEPFLIEAARRNLRAASWLNLADLYWKTGDRGLAAKAYRNYLTTLKDHTLQKEGEKAVTPVGRAVQRAATSSSPAGVP